ncbi:glycosyltransferase family 4 protein [Clostridium grantii]|nr:glycosyltransferase family 4 protein [Clostridium grantii]
MKVLMLSWEYPPMNVGGLANHVYYLSKNLAKRGIEVHVITSAYQNSLIEEIVMGVHVHRVFPINIESNDFVKNIMHLNFAIIERAITLFDGIGKVDIIHAHDWLVAYAAKTIKNAYTIPIITTIHATEQGRNNGIWTEEQKYISCTEEMLVKESSKVIACSDYMREQINKLFLYSWQDIWVIPNGVESKKFDLKFDKNRFRINYAENEEKIIFYIGRHVYEKGIQVLIESAPQVLNSYQKVKFIIGGTGPMTESLKNRVKELGLEARFIFTGYMDEITKLKLFKVADVSVFPSFYEPFGIVALEAMAAGCPVITSDIGGFREIIKHDNNGLTFYSKDSNSLSFNILRILRDKNLSEFLIENAFGTIEDDFTWNRIATITLKNYNKVKFKKKDR